MDSEMQKRIEDEADAQLADLVQAHDNGTMADFIGDYMDNGLIEVRRTLGSRTPMDNFEVMMCGGGPTALLTYHCLEVSWGSERTVRDVPRGVADEVWDCIQSLITEGF